MFEISGQNNFVYSQRSNKQIQGCAELASIPIFLNSQLVNNNKIKPVYNLLKQFRFYL